MNTISKSEMTGILDYLNTALTASSVRDAKSTATGHESDLTWRIRMARDRLIAAAISDVEVERAA